jgi:hypothetical protein
MFENHSSEKEPGTLAVPPAIETLQSATLATTYWPETIQANAERIRQAEVVSELCIALDTLYERMTVVTDGVEQYQKSEEFERVLNTFYRTCKTYLEQDPLHARLILYFPFELIPPPAHTEEQASLSVSNEASQLFREALIQAWYSLLHTRELRADYVDGDIPEVEIRVEPMPQVIKAAHLLPKLIERKLFDVDQVITLLEESSDQLLKNSIADACMVLSDTDIFTEDHLEKMKCSQDSFTNNVARIIAINKVNSLPSTTEIQAETRSFEQIQTVLTQSIESHKEEVFKNQKLSGSRRDWLIAQHKAEKVSESALEILKLYDSGSISPSESLVYISNPSLSEEIKIAVVEALEYFVQSNHSKNRELAEQIIAIVLPQLASLYQNALPNVRAGIEKTIYHLHSLNIIGTEVFATYNLTAPNLAPSGQEVIRGLKEDLKDLSNTCSKIEYYPELNEYVYPVIIITGSAMKGYQSREADLDIVIFVKPSVPEDRRGRIQELMGEVLSETRANGAMEFWLYENNDVYGIRDYVNPDQKRGDSSLTHPLTGVWCGNEEAISELYTKLMPGYVYSENKKILDSDAREIWLRDIEHNSLKYRLMHKGYARFNAPQGGINSKHADDIDGASMFYDSGYRRLATTSFIKNVFLPQLTEESKYNTVR